MFVKSNNELRLIKIQSNVSYQTIKLFCNLSNFLKINKFVC